MKTKTIKKYDKIITDELVASLVAQMRRSARTIYCRECKEPIGFKGIRLTEGQNKLIREHKLKRSAPKEYHSGLCLECFNIMKVRA